MARLRAPRAQRRWSETQRSMTETPKPTGPRFQYSLRSLLLFVTVVAVFCSASVMGFYYVIGAAIACLFLLLICVRTPRTRSKQRVLLLTALGVAFLMWSCPPLLPVQKSNAGQSRLSIPPSSVYKPIFLPSNRDYTVDWDNLNLQWAVVAATTLFLLPFFRQEPGLAIRKMTNTVERPTHVPPPTPQPPTPSCPTT